MTAAKKSSKQKLKAKTSAAKSVKRTPRKVPAKASKKTAGKRRAPPKSPVRGERERLIAALAVKLGVPEAEAELRALRDFTARLANTEAEGRPSRATSGGLGVAKNGAPATAEAAAPPAREGGLPQRLFLLLDGRGLEGHGLPIEVIESTATIGSGKFCTVWINSPQIETRHLQIQQDGDAWVLSDLNSTHGTLLGNEPLAEPRVIAHGDEYRLAGYLRMRTELR